MLLTVFLAVVFCASITLLLISAVAFVQYDGTNKWFFSSAPKEALALLKPRNEELFRGARAMGWALMIISILMILGVGVIAVWDGFRSGFSFTGFFLRFVCIFTIYKAYDMIFFDWFLLCRFRFFQYYCPRGGARVRRQEIRVQPEKPAAEAPGDLSGGLRACGLDLHAVLRISGERHACCLIDLGRPWPSLYHICKRRAGNGFCLSEKKEKESVKE